MTPYYQDSAATIYLGDCREIVPALGRFDLLLTDPPYGMNLNTDNSRFSGGNTASKMRRGNGGGTGKGVKIIGDECDFDPSFLLPLANHKIIWGWNHFANHLPKGSCLIWIKRNEEAYGTFLSDAEVAWMSSGSGVFCKKDLSNNAIANEREHPTQKPVSLMAWCLCKFPNDMAVIDPFMGSGTTLVAAKQLGRRSVGIEMEERYCEVAVKRLQQEYLDFGSPDIESDKTTSQEVLPL